MTNEAKLDEFFGRIASWERLGKRISPRGITFYALPQDENGVETGHLWFQRLFPALTEAEYSEMNGAFDVTLPEAFRQFYLQANGANLFNGTFSLYGYINERMSDLSVGLGLYNLAELQAPYLRWDGRPSFFLFGSIKRYYNTLNYLYFDSDDGRVYLTKHRYTAEPIASWESLPDMLLSEYERLEKLFTANGVEIERPISLDEDVLEKGKALWMNAMKEHRIKERKGKKKPKRAANPQQ